MSALPLQTERMLRLLKIGFTVISTGFLFYFGWQSRHILAEVLDGADPGILIVAILAWAGTHFLAPLFSLVVLRGLHVEITYATTRNVHIEHLPARYLPGGIWHTVGRIAALRGLGVSTGPITRFVILENLLAPAVAIAIGGGMLALQRQDAWGGIATFAAGAALTAVLLPIILQPWLTGRLTALHWHHYVCAMAVYLAFWTLAASAFVLFLLALGIIPADTGEALRAAATYLFAWGLGFLAIFAPQGVGVFEVVAADLLTASLPFSALALTIAGFRLVVLVADLGTWLCWQLPGLLHARAPR